MQAESAADRAGFVATADFGELFDVTPAGGGPGYQVAAIFDAAMELVDVDAGSRLASRPLTATLPQEQFLAAPAKGDVWQRVAGGESYRVAAALPDGTGFVELHLLRV